jgi:predicted site-specific integrase-resolvase
MTRAEFAERCGVSKQTVTNWINSGVIPDTMYSLKKYGLSGHIVDIDEQALDLIAAIRSEEVPE